MSKSWEAMTRFQQLLDQDEYTEPELIELDNLSQDIEQSIIDRAKYIKILEARERAVMQEIDRLKGINKSIASKIATQEQVIKNMMSSLNITNINKDPLITVKVREAPWSVQVNNIDLVPDSFKTLKVIEASVDKKKIIDFYKESNSVVSGVNLIKNKYIQII